MPAKPDFTVADHGTVFILYKNTKQAREWADEHIDPNAPTWGLNGIAVEHRYISQIIVGAQDDGLTVGGI